MAQLNLVEPEAEIQSMNWSAVGSNQLAVTVHIVNNGVVSNGTFTVSLNQDSPTGTNLFSQTIAGSASGASVDVSFIWNVAGLPDNLNVYGVLSGAGISNNVSTANTTSALTITQVLPPWIGDCHYLTNGGFQLAVYGNVDHAYTLQASTDLKNWTSVLNFVCTNSPTIVLDPGAKYLGWRFYRVAVGTLPIALRLNLAMPASWKTNGPILNLEGPLGFSYTIQDSTDLLNWQPLTNFVSTNSSFYFSDPQAKNYRQRFYRAVMQ